MKSRTLIDRGVLTNGTFRHLILAGPTYGNATVPLVASAGAEHVVFSKRLIAIIGEMLMLLSSVEECISHPQSHNSNPQADFGCVGRFTGAWPARLSQR